MKYKDIRSYKYELAEDVSANLFGGPYPSFSHEYFEIKDNILTIRKGYCWDGASGPTIDTPATMLAGLVHDALYQAIREGFLSKSYKGSADKNLKGYMREYHRFTENAKDLFATIKELFKIKSDYSKKSIIKKIIQINKELFLRFWTEFRACYFYYGVCWFGGFSIRAKKENNEAIVEV